MFFYAAIEEHNTLSGFLLLALCTRTRSPAGAITRNYSLKKRGREGGGNKNKKEEDGAAALPFFGGIIQLRPVAPAPPAVVVVRGGAIWRPIHFAGWLPPSSFFFISHAV